MKALILKSTGSWYTAKTEQDTIVSCRIKGKFRIEGIKTTNPIAVGDHVRLRGDDEDGFIIDEILKRQNYIIRRSPKNRRARQIMAANIDRAYIIATLAQPRTSNGFIDRFLVTASAYHIPATVVFNKQDLYDEDDLKVVTYFEQVYENAGYETLRTSSESGEGLEALQAAMQDSVNLVAGHSGVGKSTLVNKIAPDLDLKTKEVSSYSNKGQHTTTFAEMHELPFGGYVIDTPGIKEFGLLDIEVDELWQYFPEFAEIGVQCKFSDCKHISEPGCAVLAALDAGELPMERYMSYRKILEDIENGMRHWE